jgi:hypothetical protein
MSTCFPTPAFRAQYDYAGKIVCSAGKIKRSRDLRQSRHGLSAILSANCCNERIGTPAEGQSGAQTPDIQAPNIQATDRWRAMMAIAIARRCWASRTAGGSP